MANDPVVIREPQLPMVRGEGDQFDSYISPGMNVAFHADGVHLIKLKSRGRWTYPFVLTPAEALKLAAAIINSYPLDALGAV
jgi:hypothetical protein